MGSGPTLGRGGDGGFGRQAGVGGGGSARMPSKLAQIVSKDVAF